MPTFLRVLQENPRLFGIEPGTFCDLVSSERVTEPFGEGVCLLSGEFFGVEDIIGLMRHLAIDAEPS